VRFAEGVWGQAHLLGACGNKGVRYIFLVLSIAGRFLDVASAFLKHFEVVPYFPCEGLASGRLGKFFRLLGGFFRLVEPAGGGEGGRECVEKLRLPVTCKLARPPGKA